MDYECSIGLCLLLFLRCACILEQVNSVLDRKEALLRQLRTMNDEAEADMHLDSSGRHTEAFQAAYAQVVLDLKEVCPLPCLVSYYGSMVFAGHCRFCALVFLKGD